MQRVGNAPFIVQAQPDLIDRLAGVLIDNACKFAGDEGRVEVSVRDWGTRVDLRVDDSGPGIPDDQRDAVFDRFHRATDTWRAPASDWPSPTRWSAPPRASGRSGWRNWGAPAWRSPGEKCRRAEGKPDQIGEALSESLA